MKKIMKYIKVFMLGAAAAVTVQGCDLNEKFYSETTPDTFFTSPENVYAVLSRPFTHYRWYIGNERWYLQELTADAMTCPQRGADWYNGGEYFRLQYHTWSPDDRFVVNTYDGTTGGIARALEAKSDLSGVNYTSIGLTEADKADHLMQLDAVNAYYYMKGLDYFGGMPIYHSNNDDLKPRATSLQTFEHIESLLTDGIPKLKMKSALGKSEEGYISRAAAAAMLAQLYFNAGPYAGLDRFAECAKICQDIIDGVYGPYDLDETWWGIHGFSNDRSPEMIWCVPSENAKMQYDWYFRYFYHYNSFKYFDIETSGYNGFILTPSLDPTGQPYDYRLGNTFLKFHNSDLRKQPYSYLGNERYEGMFLVGEQINPNDPALRTLGTKEYSGKVISFVDQVARFSEVGSTWTSVADLPSTMSDGEENSGIRVVKSPQPNMADKNKRYNPDFPTIRLAEIYYMLAECKMRAGDTGGAAALINRVRERNFPNRVDPDPVTAANLDEYRMLDEWLTEFLAEGRRRTDLIRWDKFVNDNWWDHRASKDANKNLFPIPYSAIAANQLLEQNLGYSRE